MLPLTSSQRRILVNQQIYQNSKFAHMYGLVRVENQLREQIVLAICSAIDHFDCLRIRFRLINDQIYQYIVPFKDENIINKPIEYNFTNESFALYDNKMYRFFIVIKDQKIYGYYFIIHHAIVDAFTITLITSYIENFLFNKKLPNASSFLNFINTENKYLKSPAYIEHELFFESKLKLSQSYLYQPSFDLRSKRVSVKLSGVQTDTILAFCKANKISVFKLIFTSTFLYFYQISGNLNQTITTTHHNRHTEQLLSTGGMLTSTIPIVQVINPYLTFDEFLKHTTDDISIYLNKHQFPIDTLLSKKLKKECFHPTIMKVLFNSIPFGSSNYEINRFSPNEDLSELNFKLNPNSHPKGCNIELGVDYRINLYNEQEAIAILEKIIDIAFLFINYGEKIINDVLKTPKNFLIELNSIMLQTPNKVALVDQVTSITYQELNHYTNAIAKILKNCEQVIGIINQRSIWYVIGILGILKAGKAFVVIDPEMPDDRIKNILKQTNLQKILTFDDFIYPWDKLMSINITKLKPLNENITIQIGDIAYLLFTSGSTGTPKGVIISTSNLDSFYNNISSIYPNIKESRFLAAFNYNSDVSIMEILISLKTSSTLFIVNKDTILNLTSLHQYITENKIKHLLLPTILGQMFIKHYPTCPINSLLMAGEQMTYYQNTNYRVINAYGPTEFTILSHFKEITKKERRYPIGKPFSNISELIKNENLESNYGELYLIGQQMAIGYLNDINKTKTSFVQISDLPLYAYKTGDLVKRNDNGDLIFISRVDRQVKLHGYRIELAEIEIISKEYPHVEDALCVFNNDCLILYTVAKKEFNQTHFKDFLNTKLPSKYIPSQIKTVQEIPLTSSGKIDYRFIKTINDTNKEKKQKQTIITVEERKLLKIIKPYLKGESILLTDNILNTSIDSLDIIEIAFKIELIFKYPIKVSDFYMYPSIKQLAMQMKIQSRQENIIKIKKGTNKPLVFIFDLSCDILSYNNIINSLPDNIPIYTISSNFIPPHHTLKEYTTTLIDELNKKCFDLVIDIVGYSSGGIIAMEMAKQLKDRVGHLYIIDTPNYTKFPLRNKKLLLLLWKNIFNIVALYGIKKSISYSLGKFKSILKKESIIVEQNKLIKMIEQHYCSIPNTTTSLFVSSKMKKLTNNTLGWEGLNKVYYFEGNHVTIMKKPNAIKISNIIERQRNDEIK